MLRRHLWWLAPLAGAAVAGGIVVAVSLGGGSSSSKAPKTASARLRPAAAALAFQQTPSGLGSGYILDSDGDPDTNNHVVGECD